MHKKRILGVVFGTLLLDTIGIGMVIPIIPIIFTDPSSPSFLLSGYSQSAQFFIAGLITALFGLMQFLAAPLLGELSDVYGRKRLLTVGVAVLALSQFMFGFGIEIASIALLFVSRTIAGLAGANFSIAQATIADVTEPHERAKNFGLIGAAFGIGFILGPLLGGWIAGVVGDPASPFWVAGALGIINMLFLTFFLPETHKRPTEEHSFTLLKGFHNIRAAFKDVDARPVYLANFLYMCGFAFFTSFIAVFLVNEFGFTETGVGTFFAVVGGCIVVTQLFILRILASKYNERQILRYSILLVGVINIIYPFMPSVAWLYFLIPLMAVPQGLTMANISSLVSKSVSREKQGAALGISGSLMAFAQGVVPIIAGVGSGLLSVQAPFVVGGLLMISAWSVLFVFSPRQ